jgi:DNA-binding transcriptional ArsR family regulator
MTAGEIASQFLMSRPAISRHLRVLRQAGLVRARRVAQSRIYALDAAPLTSVDRWLDSYRVLWSARRYDFKPVVESAEDRV